MMVVLPSSPVWYQSRGIDTSHNGILAFGSRNLVYLLDLSQKRPEIYGILGGHTDKVTSCSFCPPIGKNHLLRLVSGADDCSVKIWDAQQKLMLNEHSAHGNNKLISVHWSPVNPSLILSCDEKGFVICWNLEKSSTDRFCPDGSSQMNLTCLTCAPHHENIVAIGYKSGAVSIMDIKRNGTVVKKLRGHASDIHGIVWVPHGDESLFFNNKQILDDNEDNEPGKSDYDGVLLTGSKDKTIKVWSVNKSKCIKTMRIPNRTNKGRKVNEDAARLYTTLHWPAGSETKFISSGYNGDLIVWDIDPNAENLFEIIASQTHDAGHQRIVFNISCGSDPHNTIVSTSMDRRLLHWTIPDHSPSLSSGPDWTLSTLGGFVYSVDVSPNDPSMVAIGVGDGMIRIWKTRSSKSAYDILTLWQGIKEKVMALSWHPTKEGCLAFATEDGKVGIYDILSMRPPILAETYHLKPVYALSWGPKCTSKLETGIAQDISKDLQLYSCGGDGVILQHDPSNMSKDALNIDKIIASSNSHQMYHPGKHSEVSWSQDGRLLAIGNDNGNIGVLSPPYLCQVLEIKVHTKLVNRIRWRPISSIENASDIHREIATGSNNSTIQILDLSKTFADANYTIGDEPEQPIMVSKASKSLVGHLSRITGLSYNPRSPSEIVSASYDSTAQVWDIDREKPLFNFRGHHGRLMCGVWTSVIDEANSNKTSGIIYTGADDYTVHGWYAEDQQHTEPVKVIPDFGFGPKNKFQSKKKGRQKKNTQHAQQQQTTNANMTQADSIAGVRDLQSPDIDALLENKKAELIASMNGDASNADGSSGSMAQSAVTNFYKSFQAFDKSLQGPQNSSLISTSSPVQILLDDALKPLQGDDVIKKKKRMKNMFPQSVTMDNRKKASQHQDCLKIVQWNTRDACNANDRCDNLAFVPGDSDHINLGFYTDRRAAFRMMKNEAAKHNEEEIAEGSSSIRFWMGDVAGAIEEATEKNQLTDQLVAFAPMAGQAFWRKTAYAFAKQLQAEEHHMHSVQYLLICDKVHEAIQALLDSRNYREAVALAKARLCDDDPFLRKTVEIWAKKLDSGGSVELAAKCYASIGEYERAALSLSQRATSGASNITDSDISSLWAAASVATAANKQELATGFAERALTTVCVRTWNWKSNTESLCSFPNLKCYRFIAMVHEMVTSWVISSAKVDSPSTMSKSEWNNDLLWSKGCAFPELLIQVWNTQNGSGDFSLHLDIESLKHIHTLATHHRKDDVTETKIFFLIAYSLAGAICLRTALSREECTFHQSSTQNPLPDVANSFASEFTAIGCLQHILHCTDILSRSTSLNDRVLSAMHTVILEVINWIYPEMVKIFNSESCAVGIKVPNENGDGITGTHSEYSTQLLSFIQSKLNLEEFCS